MIRFYHPKDVKATELDAIMRGDSSIEMIKRAANAILDHIIEANIAHDRVLVIAGKGNNGADGLYLGRILRELGAHVDFYKTSNKQGSEENLFFSKELSFLKTFPKNLSTYSLIIDALYGIGFHGVPATDDALLIKSINESSTAVLSIDLPSGVDGSTGAAILAVNATYTCALNSLKAGHLIYPGAHHCGILSLLDCRIPLPCQAQGTVLTTEDLYTLNTRPARSHKGTFGKIGIVAGCDGMAGAAYLSACAAYFTGAGLVEIFTTEENRVVLQTLLPEAILHCYNEHTPTDALLEELKTCDAAVIGPGLGKSKTSQNLVFAILSSLTLPCVIDADGLNLCCQTEFIQNYRGQAIITPHPAEAARLLSFSVQEILNDPLFCVRELSKQFNCTAVLKDAHTLISTDENLCINLSGNNGMATGGCGDVLTGIIAALLVSEKDTHRAASLGVYIHGLSGDAASKKHGKRSVTASRVLESIEDVLKEVN